MPIILQRYLPDMKRLNCFCFFCDIRTAAVCVGWIAMVYSIVCFSVTEIMLSKEARMEAWTDESAVDTAGSFLAKHLSIFYRVGNGVSVLLYGMLLYGVHIKNPVYIRPWLGFKFFCLQLSLIIDIAYCIRIVDYLGKCGIILIIMFVIKTAVDVFVLFVCYSYYRQLERETGSVSVCGVVHYAYQNLSEDESVQNSPVSSRIDANANNVVQKILL